jgi:hypothetical protein
VSAVNAAPRATAAPNAVLYDQYDNKATTGGINSQDFDPGNDAFDDQAADDFVVPTGQSWSITGVDVDGYYTNGPGPAASVHVYFYANGAGNLPGTLVASRLSNPYASGPAAGDFVITLSSPVLLNPGTYWVSVQAREDFTPAGRWFWEDRTLQANEGAAWQNPNNGIGSGCTTWTRKTACNAGSPFPDQVFRLVGFVGSPTAVRLVSLSAKRHAAGVAISWRTVAETDVLGFNVWRQPARATRRWVKLNTGLIRARAHDGGSYTYLDRTTRARVQYAYRLETVHLDGSVTRSRAVVVARG